MKNDTSWKRLLLLTTCTAGVVALLHKIGYQGKNRPMVSPSSWEDAALYFGVAFVFLFMAFFICARLIAWFYGRSKKEPTQAPEPARTFTDRPKKDATP